MIFLTRFTSALVLLSCAAFSAQGDIIVQYNPGIPAGDTRYRSSVPLEASFVETGITASPITQEGLGSFSSTSNYPIGGWDATPNFFEYVTLTLTPQSGVIIDFDDVVWDKGFFSSGTDDGTIRTSLDGFSTNVATGTDANGDLTFDLSSLPDVVGLIEFRFYFSGGTFSDLSVGTGENGLIFNGTVVPEPASLSLLALGGALMIRRRRGA